MHLKCDVTCAETRFRLSVKRARPNRRERQFSRLLASIVCGSARSPVPYIKCQEKCAICVGGGAERGILDIEGHFV